MEETIRLNANCIQLDIAASDWKQAIQIACQPLIDHGFVSGEYPQDVIERELQWATGLPTEPFGIAIPHALTAEHVQQAQIGVCRLVQPVLFRQSGGTPGEDDVACKIVFVLALKDPHAQLSLLQKLMAIISDETLLRALEEAESPCAFRDVFAGASSVI